jgi:para-nitrobenzyl esterase
VDCDTAVANTPFGPIRGVPGSAGLVFRGIRYATAERFEAPIAVTGWEGELDASADGPQCPQLFGMLERALGGSAATSSEDCLSLNVYTPACDDRRRPVMVWIHGGGFTTGSGSMPWYHGGALASRGDVVVVAINYRLGVFGFSGRTNCGLRDQIAALEWVHACIGAFGGDAASVTIVGESAGGASVVALMATPAANGLFHRAVAMSPSLGQLRSGERADDALAQFVAAAGVEHLDDLRLVPVDALLDVQREILKPTSAGFTGFSPCTDGDLVPRPIIESAGANPVPLMIGTTRDEMRLFHAFDPAVNALDDAAVAVQAERRFPGRGDEVVRRYQAARSHTAPSLTYSAIITDELFRMPMLALADARSEAGLPTWVYWFTWASPAFNGILGSCHAVDIPFLFDNLHHPGVEQFLGADPNRSRVALAYGDAVIAHATHAQPGWPAHHPTSRATMVFDVHSRVELDPDFQIRSMW